ncbi:MAG: class I SAM-dependent methyltransferase [Candidatus Krumholzibacteriota bacterium]
METKQAAYYRNLRPEMLEFIPDEATVLLEIGCGAGAFAANLKKVRQAAGSPVEVWGVEKDEGSAGQAAAVLDRVLQGDVAAVLPDLPAAHFDCLILNDVVEHVPDPGALLRSVRPLLKPGGHLVASIPNVRYFFNVVDLAVHGRWDYTDEGILDRTHLRFFTRSSMIRLLEECGYVSVATAGINPTRSVKFGLVNLMTLGRWSDMKYLQFACLARAGRRVE